MANTTQEIFGSARPELAEPGSYGQQPQGFRLPADTRLGAVHLRIADLARSVAFYETVLGMRVIARGDARATLGAHGSDRALV